MLRRFSTGFAIILALASARAAIDFTPSVREYKSEGFVYQKVKLKTDTGTISFAAPLGWNVSGGKGRLVMLPTRNALAEATVVGLPLAAPVVYDEVVSKNLEQQALAAVPPGSQSVELKSRDENPVMGQNTSVEFVVSYSALGRQFQRSVMFVYTPDTQLVFRLTAPKADFAALNQAFRQCIHTWEWTETKAEVAGNTPTATAPAPSATAN